MDRKRLFMNDVYFYITASIDCNLSHSLEQKLPEQRGGRGFLVRENHRHHLENRIIGNKSRRVGNGVLDVETVVHDVLLHNPALALQRHNAAGTGAIVPSKVITTVKLFIISIASFVSLSFSSSLLLVDSIKSASLPLSDIRA